MRNVRVAASCACALAVAISTDAAAECPLTWLSPPGAWEAPLLTGPPASMTVFDADGPAGNPPRLFVLRSTPSGGYEVLGWSGSAWDPLHGIGPITANGVITTADPDGAGPAAETLVAMGSQGWGWWTGVNWTFRQWNLVGLVDAQAFDADGPGPAPSELFIAGSFAHQPDVPDCLARWNGTTWLPVGGGVSGSQVNALALHDPDGPGPQNAQLAVVGDFTRAGSMVARGIALWDGASWRSVGGGLFLENRAGHGRSVTSFDPDGSGPAHPLLIVSGDFSHAGLTFAPNIAAWNGSAWLPLSWGLERYAQTLATFDPDGDSARAPQLYAGGSFTYAGKSLAYGVARWDGQQWSSMGTDQGAGANGFSRPTACPGCLATTAFS